MTIPQSDILSTNRLGRVFTNTSATYKFFWFVSILQIHAQKDCSRIDVWDIVIRMVANAWYPIHYFRLSFGKSDSLFDIVMELQRITGIPIDAQKERVIKVLSDNVKDKRIKEQLLTLTLNVPYRFLSPWITYSSNIDTIRRSQTFQNGCLYALHKNEADFFIELNPIWNNYLHAHYNILVDFAFWNLTLFLQVRNPNVPNIPNKLIKSETRNSLALQHQYWDFVMEHGLKLNCIYTKNPLAPKNYDLDHFIPWSFVSHDLLWNLMPADASINSSKSNKLPDLDIYLPRLATVHQQAIKICLREQYRGTKILEDYLSLGKTPQELVEMDKEHLLDCFMRIFSPMNQIALNMGFETWKY